MPEYGIFSETAGGCIFAPCYSSEEATSERTRLIGEGEDADDLTIHEMCLDHRYTEQPKNGCEDCNAESEGEN